jgi:hypothetical protein
MPPKELHVFMSPIRSDCLPQSLWADLPAEIHEILEFAEAATAE